MIPKRLPRLLRLGPGSRLWKEELERWLEPSGKTANARDVIGCSGYHGLALPIEAMGPARYASKP